MVVGLHGASLCGEKGGIDGKKSASTYQQKAAILRTVASFVVFVHHVMSCLRHDREMFVHVLHLIASINTMLLSFLGSFILKDDAYTIIV